MATVSKAKQREAYARTHGICVVCGKSLGGDESTWSADHFIPRAVYKWVPGKKLRTLIESADNIFITHPRCNLEKNSSVPTMASIGLMHADEDVLDGMRALRLRGENRRLSRG